ncbi:putative Nuclear factor of activated T-cells 5 [Hypsibius exemplaris]|uniref:Nuclear factor of activated T-cells 5 n=1 Tax=Hypsibius exemplaris TaxID=2072580 RepID=A0A1W0XE77_HYPEX|nr:putative Nuclear factor of activated T-cells 5 [Hypsibius exemplaris]
MNHPASSSDFTHSPDMNADLSTITSAPPPSPFLEGGLSMKMSPTTRSRLATWTASPDSGYSDATGTVKFTGGRSKRKRRANSLENQAGGLGSEELDGRMIVEQQQDALSGRMVQLEGGRREEAVETFVYPHRVGHVELVVLRQPEAQHRPRYQTEGSRGRIKDRSGSLSPAVQLKNFSGKSAILQVYVAVEEGVEALPHPLFKICKVNNKTAAPAVLRQLWGNVAVLEMAFSGKRDWTVDVDCVSLLKLRNVDCEEVPKTGTVGGETLKRIRNRRGMGGSAKIRLAFRAVLTMYDGSKQTLQVTSTPIACCSTLGTPEVNFLSHHNGPASGGLEIIVLGRSFLKNDSKLMVVERSMDEELIWEQEATQMPDKFNQVHIVARLPPYRDRDITRRVSVFLCVRNNDGKQSDLMPFTYTPDPIGAAAPTTSLSPAAADPAASQFPNSNSSDYQPASGPSILPRSEQGDPFRRQLSLNSGYAQPEQLPEQAALPRRQSAGPGGEGNFNVSHPAPAAPDGATIAHYSVELPGMTQPIIISIPVASTVSVGAVAPDGGASDCSYDLPSHHGQIQLVQQSQQQLSGGAQQDQYSDQFSQQQQQEHFSQPLQETMEHDPVSAKAFDDLLREILGPNTEDAATALGVGQGQNLSAEESWLLSVEGDQLNINDDPDADFYPR